MAENVELEIKVKGSDSVQNASDKLKSAKTQLRELKDLLASGTLGGQEFEKVAAQAGALEDKIGDVNKKVKNLSSDTGLLDGFTSVTQGIIGGFTAAQGAMALFGDENKDLQKQLVKVQGAVALLNGFQAVANTLNKDSAAMTLLQSTRLKVLTAIQTRYTLVVQGTTGAMKALRIAGAALGIGLIIAAIALLISNFDKIKKAVLNFLPSLETLKNTFYAVKNAITDFLGITSDATREYDKLEKATEKYITKAEEEIEVMKIRGETAYKIWVAERELINRKLQLLQASLKAHGDLTDEELKQAEDLQREKRILNETYFASQEKEADKNNKAQQDKAKKNSEDRKKQAELDKANALTASKESLKIAEDRENILGTLTLDRQRFYLQEKLRLGILSQDEYTNAMLLSAKTESDLEAENNQKSFDDLFASLDAEATLEQEYKDKQKAIDEKERLDKINNEKAAYEQRVAIATDGLNALSSLTTAFASKSEQGQRRAFAINKALNISTAIIDTYMAAQKAYTSQLSIPTPDAPIRAQVAAGVAIAGGLARVAAISKTEFGSGNVSNVGGGSFSNQAPRIQGFTTNNTPQRQTGQNGNFKVYVTETDIRNAGNKVGSIYQQAMVE